MKPLSIILVAMLIVIFVAGAVLRFFDVFPPGGGDEALAAAGPQAAPTHDSVLVTLFSSSTKRDWLDFLLDQGALDSPHEFPKAAYCHELT